MKKIPDWDGIFCALEKWRETAGEDSSVTALAKRPEPEKPWRVLASTILSLRTKDEVTAVAAQALLKKAPGPAALLKLDEKEIALLIYPVGFYRTKAANLRRIAKILLDQYDGEPPPDMDALLTLPGVGRKTANLVLIEGFGLDGICVDTHVHRISNRAGWVETPGPGKTEARLREILPRCYWQVINRTLVLYGQQVCRPQSPFCSRCVLMPWCERRGVERSR